MGNHQQHFCETCGKKIREYNVENFKSRCADCWFKEKDDLERIEKPLKIKNLEKHREQLLENRRCYICEKPGSVQCNWCCQPICGEHTVPGRQLLRTFYCDRCYSKLVGRQVGFLCGFFILLFGSLGIAILILN